MEITSRQTFILRKLVQAHVEMDQPVGSKWIAEQDDVPWTRVRRMKRWRELISTPSKLVP